MTMRDPTNQFQTKDLYYGLKKVTPAKNKNEYRNISTFNVTYQIVWFS